MDLTDYLSPDAIALDVVTTDLPTLVTQMARQLEKADKLSSVSKFVQEVLEREELGSTALPVGVAIPHARSQYARELAIGFCRLNTPLRFAGAGVEPVSCRLIFLLATPHHEAKRHVQLLGQLARAVNTKAVRDGLVRADSIDDVLRLLATAS